jgi:hypothetical protein
LSGKYRRISDCGSRIQYRHWSPSCCARPPSPSRIDHLKQYLQQLDILVPCHQQRPYPLTSSSLYRNHLHVSWLPNQLANMADSYYETAQPLSAASDSSFRDREDTHSFIKDEHRSFKEEDRSYSPNTSTNYGGGGYGNGNGSVAESKYNSAPVKKNLGSWVGFSNLPNQVHRRSTR